LRSWSSHKIFTFFNTVAVLGKATHLCLPFSDYHHRWGKKKNCCHCYSLFRCIHGKCISINQREITLLSQAYVAWTWPHFHDLLTFLNLCQVFMIRSVSLLPDNLCSPCLGHTLILKCTCAYLYILWPSFNFNFIVHSFFYKIKKMNLVKISTEMYDTIKCRQQWINFIYLKEKYNVLCCAHRPKSLEDLRQVLTDICLVCTLQIICVKYIFRK
jgi:hypothetical protein